MNVLMKTQAVPIPLAKSKLLIPVPRYLQDHYWWAYVHPRAVNVFERQWLVNLILWGSYNRLCNAILDGYGHKLSGSTLQVACAYGDLTPRLAACMTNDASFEVVDILQIQLDNLASKLPQDTTVRLQQMDSSGLKMESAMFDRVLLFFLLHEQPEEVRRKTLLEALRVVRPGGTLTIVDYAPPSRFNPLRYLWCPLVKVLEPFAGDLFCYPIKTWLPSDESLRLLAEQRFFGGIYQLLTLQVVE